MTAVIEWRALAPVLLVLVAAILGILAEAVVPKAQRFFAQVFLTVASIVAAAAFLVANWRAGLGGPVAMGSMMLDGPTYFMWGALLVFGLGAILVFAERQLNGGVSAFAASVATVPGSRAEAEASAARLEHTEVFPLALFALGGMMVFPAASNLITMFVALEVLSLPLYVLTGLARRRRLLSQEAALKYFLLGAFSSAFFLFGAALLYGFAGSSDLRVIAAAISTTSSDFDGLLVPGVVLVLIGLLFKVGAVPFHSWTPDVYQGAPTPITGFMAACTKLAAFGVILRVTYVGVTASRWDWSDGLWAVAAITMVVGAVLSVTQTDVKRLLAYSSIAHAGFILVGVLAFSQAAIGGVMFYLVAYGFATVAAFGIIAMVRQGGSEASHLSQWAGLGRRHPVVAGAFSFLLLAFAGIPLTSGFTAKFAAFAPAVEAGTGGVVLVVIAVLASAVTAFVYVRLIVLMYFTEASTEEGDEVVALTPSIPSTIGITVGVLVTAVLGIVPGFLLDIASSASEFLL